jgi:hypothetical protein
MYPIGQGLNVSLTGDLRDECLVYAPNRQNPMSPNRSPGQKPPAGVSL